MHHQRLECSTHIQPFSLRILSAFLNGLLVLSWCHWDFWYLFVILWLVHKRCDLPSPTDVAFGPPDPLSVSNQRREPNRPLEHKLKLLTACDVVDLVVTVIFEYLLHDVAFIL